MHVGGKWCHFEVNGGTKKPDETKFERFTQIFLQKIKRASSDGPDKVHKKNHFLQKTKFLFTKDELHFRSKMY